jgi:hypothetical protein
VLAQFTRGGIELKRTKAEARFGRYPQHTAAVYHRDDEPGAFVLGSQRIT